MKSFRDFMEERVREYYLQRKVGDDFFTAPELDRSFGRALSDHLYQFVRHSDNPLILELGGGNGSLAYDILSFFREKDNKLYGKLTYYIYEESPTLVSLQKNRLREFEGKVFWTQELITEAEVVLSNEFFDCLPVHVIKGRKELYVDDGKAVWEDISDERILSFLDRMGYSALDQIIEVCLDCIDLLRRLSNIVRGYHIVIDYGYTSEEIAKYPNGTVVGYKAHRVVRDVFKEAPPFDMSAMVNFSALVEYGKDFGLLSVSFQNMREFLLSSPIFLEELEKLSLSEKAEDIERLSRLKTMLISMGERFKVLIQKKL